MKERIKLKHLRLFIEEEISYTNIMKEVFGFKGNKVKKLLTFHRVFKKAYQLTNEVSNIEIDKIEHNPDSPIKIPENIDDITFAARMEVESQINKMDQGDLVYNIARVIALTCFSDNINSDFDVNKGPFKNFMARILNEPALDMIGHFNSIKTSLTASNGKWEKLFKGVDSTDPDFIQAGGQQMSRFNVINTIKAICRDFNYNYDQAWQMPYIVVQMSSLEGATESWIQNKMAKIKEKRMLQKRGMGAE